MRTMLKVQVPVEAGNASIKSGALPRVIGQTLDRLKPEAAYFFTENGLRTALMVFDMKDPSDIPGIAEPFFMELNGAVTFVPVMNADDLKRGLEKAGG